MENQNIAVVGLGYVGLPLAIEFSKFFPVVGFDSDQQKINQLRDGIDRTQQISVSDLRTSQIQFTTDLKLLAKCTIFVIAVPTGFNKETGPNLDSLCAATETVASVLKKNDLVVFESTVFPGCIEDVCARLLEKKSGLIFNIDFFCGYSPERVNPGDKSRSITSIVKITSGSNPETADKVDALYKTIVSAGTFKTSSIRVAEAAKIIENAQRYINVAFVNEVALILNQKGIDTNEVLTAAGSKWNFLPFQPGLVGGHCLELAAQYLTYGTEKNQLLHAAAEVNNYVPYFIASRVLKLIRNKKTTLSPKVLILGATFKENFPDIRNSQAPIIFQELTDAGCVVDIFDPIADVDNFFSCYSIRLCHKDILDNLKPYDAIICAVAHSSFFRLELGKKLYPETIIYDAKGFLPRDHVDERL